MLHHVPANSLSHFPPASVPSPLLAIEASTAAGSVALFLDGVSAGRLHVAMGATRDDTLFPSILALLSSAQIMPSALQGVVCGAGPGSFTSLRIAASLAKGLAFAASCPLFAVSSLLLAAAECEVPGEYLVHSDALRGERYVSFVRVDRHGMTGLVGDIRREALEVLPIGADRPLRLAVGSSPAIECEWRIVIPDAARVLRCTDWQAAGAVALDAWEPSYGRLAEAQVKWEHTHGRSLSDG